MNLIEDQAAALAGAAARPDTGKTKKACIWGYARSEFDGLRRVVCNCRVGRGAKYPVALLVGWNCTLVCDDCRGDEPVFKLGSRIEAACELAGQRAATVMSLAQSARIGRAPGRRD